jgi:hypothetical protein
MSQLFRIDSEKQKLNWEKLDNGTYRAFITLGVADLPLHYIDALGNKHTEIIEEEDLFNEDSLKTAYGLPICLNHPKFGTYNQNAENILVGHTLETFLKQDSALLMTATITDKRGIDLIDSMIDQGEYAEISPGYWVEELIKKDSNVYCQKKRKYDHLALLSAGEGRGGQKIVLRTDSNVSTCVSTVLETCIDTYENDYETVTTETVTEVIPKTVNMKKVLFQGKEFEVVEDLAIALDSATVQLDSITKERDSALGQLEATKIQLDSKKELITLDAASQFVKESIELWRKVEPVFKADSKDFEADYSLKPVQIKELYIKKFHPAINLDGKSAEFIDGIWLGISDSIQGKLNVDAVDKVKNQLEQLNAAEVRNDAANPEIDPVEKARQEQNSRILNANKN